MLDIPHRYSSEAVPMPRTVEFVSTFRYRDEDLLREYVAHKNEREHNEWEIVARYYTAEGTYRRAVLRAPDGVQFRIFSSGFGWRKS